jgi:hypothetical protein
MCGNCHGKASGSSKLLNYILDVTWQCLLYVLHDVSKSLPCLLAKVNGAHSIFHMKLICEYILNQRFTPPLYQSQLNVNLQSRSYCHFQVFVSMKRVGIFPRLELSILVANKKIPPLHV